MLEARCNIEKAKEQFQSLCLVFRRLFFLPETFYIFRKHTMMLPVVCFIFFVKIPSKEHCSSHEGSSLSSRSEGVSRMRSTLPCVLPRGVSPRSRRLAALRILMRSRELPRGARRGSCAARRLAAPRACGVWPPQGRRKFSIHYCPSVVFQSDANAWAT